jgi:uncharacterized membrane protein
MRTPANIGGHPVHPMLIPFPFALWTFSLIADAIYYFFDHNALSVWDDVAFYTMAGGTVGAVVAAVPGIIDYFSIKDPRASKMAAWHARLNVLALLIFGADLYLRTNKGSDLVGRRLTIRPSLDTRDHSDFNLGLARGRDGIQTWCGRRYRRK